MNKCQGSSGLSLLMALAIICFILFYIAPKYLKNTASSVKTEETLSSSSEKSIPYVDTYNKGMAGARAAVEASKERNKSID